MIWWLLIGQVVAESKEVHRVLEQTEANPESTNALP